MRERHVSPRSAPLKQSYTTAKVVRVRNLQAPLGPIDLDRQVAVPLHIETCMKANDRPLLELQKSIKMCWNFDRKFFALLGAGSENSLDKTSTGYRRTLVTGPSRLINAVM